LASDPFPWRTSRKGVPFAGQVRLVVEATRKGHVHQARALVCNQAACALEPEHASGQFGRNTNGIAKTLTEMAPAITDFICELLDWYQSVGLLESFPRPRNLGLHPSWIKLRDKRPVQHGEPLLPRIGHQKHLHEIAGAVSPDLGETQNER